MKKILKYLIILGLLQANANASSEPPTEGLLAKYNFDNGEALDISGNNRHGQVFGATKTKDRFGQEDKALKFDGSSYVSVDGPWPSGTSSRSIVAWYNCPSHFGNLFTFGDGNKRKETLDSPFYLMQKGASIDMRLLAKEMTMFFTMILCLIIGDKLLLPSMATTEGLMLTELILDHLKQPLTHLGTYP